MQFSWRSGCFYYWFAFQRVVENTSFTTAQLVLGCGGGGGGGLWVPFFMTVAGWLITGEREILLSYHPN